MDILDPANSRGTSLARLGYDVIGSISLENALLISLNSETYSGNMQKALPIRATRKENDMGECEKNTESHVKNFLMRR